MRRVPALSRVARGVALGAIIGLFGALGGWLLSEHGLEDDVDLYWLFNLRGPVAPPDDVLVVAIDQASARRLGLPPEQPRAWPRRIHAQALRRAMQGGAAVVAFDLQFDGADGNAENDLELEAAIRDARDVVLVESIMRETIRLPAAPGRAPGQFVIDTPLPPAENLRAAARGVAAFPLPKSSRVDAYWAFLSRTESRMSLPVMALHVMAMPAYEDLERVWARAAAGNAEAELPPPASMAAMDTAHSIVTLRRVIAANPDVRAEAFRHIGEQRMTPRNARLVRALLSMYSGPAERYLNYYGPAHTIRTVKYDELLALPGGSERLRDMFAGKAVFIGYSGRTAAEQDRIRDDYPTVFSEASGLSLSGVEIAATAFANILDDSDVRRLTLPARLTLLLLAGVALGVLARIVRPVSAAIAVVVAAGGYLATAAWLFSTHSVALPLVLPLAFQAPLALLAGSLLWYRDAKREREAIKQKFGYFVPKSVVEHLAEGIGPISEDHQLVHGACVVSDVAGYSAMAERIAPADLGRLMDDYFAQLFRPVRERGGIVLDVVGDGMLAIWTSHVADVAYRREACHAALDIAASVDRFNEHAPPDRVLRTRVALHCGELMLGSFGAADHFEYRAVGDIVNATSRIEGLNKVLGTRVLASGAVLEGLDEFFVRPVGTFVLAGKSQPIAVSELMGLCRDADPARLALRDRFADAFVGYSRGEWRSAAERFEAILRDFPGDGPAAFYRDRCIGLAGVSPTPWNPVIRLAAK